MGEKKTVTIEKCPTLEFVFKDHGDKTLELSLVRAEAAIEMIMGDIPASARNESERLSYVLGRVQKYFVDHCHLKISEDEAYVVYRTVRQTFEEYKKKLSL